MAAVFLSPAPQKLGGMSNRRVPLGNVPNAANSPFRAVAAAASKRSRGQLEAQEDHSFDLQPQAKRQALEGTRSQHRTPPRRLALQSVEGRVFNKRPSNVQPTAFERKLLAARGDTSKQRVDKQEKASYEQRGDIRQWQKHFKKLFPSFVFYFESVPEDVRVYCSNHVRSLGAKEEKFFSREVTHVITTRQIPVDKEPKDSTDLAIPSSTSTSSQPSNPPRTINPSLLNRHSDCHGEQPQSRNRFMFEATASKRAPLTNTRDVQPRKAAGNVDVLARAKEMGMKVWPLDKLQRAIRTMFEIPSDSQVHPGLGMRPKGAIAVTKDDREAELSRMLRNERINGPSDRDSTIAPNETVPFKGYHIYIRDMDERTKPIMIRDYPKPLHDELSEWPQFRCVGTGKCPFVPEAEPPMRQDHEKAKAREEELRRPNVQNRQVPRTRAAVIPDDAEAETVKNVAHHRPLQELKDRGNASAVPPARMPTQPFCPPPGINAKATSPAKAAKESIASTNPRLFGGEPAASGMQPSNITSAIRSQMISSTAAGPGTKAGTSREVHGLKRKVLEKNTGPAPTNMQTRHRSVESMGDGRAEKTISAARQSRRQAQEPLIHIDEETTQSEADEDVWMTEDVRTKHKQQKGVVEKRNVRPGYCENCREKYDDFDDHIVGRKHRKFALARENWKDLDLLLSHLGRPLKEQNTDDF